jgi:hypothetical protein
MLDPATIQVDAETYQFRSGGDPTGVKAGSRYHTDKWDPILHGDPIMVHERLDGRIFVADGHHRLDLANRLNEEGKGPDKLAATVLREADGYSAEDVKIIAAYKNISHGRTDPVDAARVFKEAESGKVHKELLPNLQLDKGNLRISYSMSKLSDKAIDSVAKGEVSPHMAAEVAERIPGDQKHQEAVIEIIHQKLKQNYEAKPDAHPTAIHYNCASMAKESPEVTVPTGHVAKLAAQRAQSSAATISR